MRETREGLQRYKTETRVRLEKDLRETGDRDQRHTDKKKRETNIIDTVSQPAARNTAAAHVLCTTMSLHCVNGLIC